MIIKQPYIDNVGKRQMKNIEITLDEMCLAESATNQPALVAKVDSHIIVKDISDIVLELLDAKRTFGLRQSIVVSCNGWNINVLDIDVLKVKIGDPIAIIGSRISYTIVSGISGNVISVVNEVPIFDKGAIIRNLACKYEVKMGARSLLMKPEPIPFVVIREPEVIRVLISLPINLGSIKYYDVYVRKTKFYDIKPWWSPDIADVDIFMDEVIIPSKEECYVGVVVKDKLGMVNINESNCTVVKA